MLNTASPLPAWLDQTLWSAIVILASWLLIRFATRLVCRWLTALAARTRWQWDDLVVNALERGSPVWSLLLGAYIALSLWPLPPVWVAAASRALYVLAWLSVTVVAAGLSGRLIALYGRQFQHALPMTSLTENIIRILIVILGGLMILNGMGISITPLLTALGVGGIAVALALQDTLSNLFAGLYLAMSGHVRVGDFIRLDSGQEGYVADISWRATQVRMLPNNMVLVPNNKLGQATIVNYYLPSKTLAVTVEVGVAYDSNLDYVEQVTTEVAREVMQTVAGGVPEFAPFVRYHTLGEYSVQMTVILQAKEFVDQYLIKHEFLKRLLARYRNDGITIPFPTRTMLTQG